MRKLLPEILAVALFGSCARDDSDAYSDRDLLLVIDDVDFEQIENAKQLTSKSYGVDIEQVSAFTRSTFDFMISNGSLFAHHLALESRPLYDPDGYLALQYQHVKPFVGFRRELTEYRQLLEDVASDARRRDLVECDLHLLHMIVRNICILLTYHGDCPDFGRESTFHVAKELYPRGPFNDKAFAELTAWHLAYQRDVRPKLSLPSRNEQRGLIEFVANLHGFAETVLP